MESMRGHAPTRRNRRFESDEVIVTAQEIVDAYFPLNSVLVQD